MWRMLRNKRLGASFRRQYPLAGYVLDFYSPELRLCVEVDGKEFHEGRWAYDQNRDLALRAEGIRTVRIPAKTVLQQPDEAEKIIKRYLRLAPLRSERPSSPNT